MTICIAASCEGSKKCVVGADREVTATGLSLEFEHEKKIDTIGQSCAVMAAGDSLLAAEVIEKTRREVIVRALSTIQQIAESLAAIYLQCHLERAESVILRPRGLTWGDYQQFGAHRLPLQMHMNIDQLLFNFGLGAVEFLVAGVDENGAHIFRIHYDGIAGGSWVEWCDSLGFRTIGSGGSHAAILLALQRQQKMLPVGETLFNVYSAKKNAEIAPGVGSQTDIAIVDSSKVTFLEAAAFKKMDDLRQEMSAAYKVPPEKVKDLYV